MYRSFVTCDDPKGVEEFGSRGRRSSKRKESDLIKEALQLKETLAEFQKMHYSKSKHREAVCDAPSTSSSDRDSRALAIVQKRKKEAPNLIARLMGLEELPKKNNDHLPGRILRPVLDVDTTMKRKSMDKVGKGKTLKDLLEIVRREGLLKASSATQTRSYDLNCVDGRVADDVLPAVVLIKPFPPKRIKSGRRVLADEILVKRVDHQKTKNSRVSRAPYNQKIIEIGERKVNKLQREVRAGRKIPKTMNTREKINKETPKSNTPEMEIEIARKIISRRENSFVVTGAKTKKITETKDLKTMEAKLVIDYMKEYVDRSVWEAEGSVWYDKLMEEIRRGLDTMKMYSEAGDNERRWKLGLKEEVGGRWEWGCGSGFSSLDVQMAVADVENLLLIDLMKELLS